MDALIPKTQDGLIHLMMEAAKVGADWGLDLAQARLNGASEYQPLSWEHVIHEIVRRQP